MNDTVNPDNIPDDMGRCMDLVENHLLPASQYFGRYAKRLPPVCSVPTGACPACTTTGVPASASRPVSPSTTGGSR